MSLETNLQTIKKEFADLRERMTLNVGAEARYAIEQSRLAEEFRIKETIQTHLSKYPEHEALCFGNGVSLYGRAVEFLNEEFGKRTLFKGELKRDKAGNPQYESLVWFTKKLEQRLAGNPLTQEIYDVVPKSELIQHLKPFRKMNESEGTFFGGLLGSMAVGTGLIALLFPPAVVGGVVLGPTLLILSHLTAPKRLVLENYLLTAKRAGTFLQGEVRPYLIRQLNPYRSVG